MEFASNLGTAKKKKGTAEQTEKSRGKNMTSFKMTGHGNTHSCQHSNAPTLTHIVLVHIVDWHTFLSHTWAGWTNWNGALNGECKQLDRVSGRRSKQGEQIQNDGKLFNSIMSVLTFLPLPVFLFMLRATIPAVHATGRPWEVIDFNVFTLPWPKGWIWNLMPTFFLCLLYTFMQYFQLKTFIIQL